ncbi:MAG: crotonase/enoyl-CoA hydratase family protein [Halioglobus sp.]|jgi:enoyl-CoA hydratase|nr:enoyl-CoA hydratase/isomerase family protein [marine gamma proteobacterium HTCC2148]MBT3409518.1 crotonase/enoyl-CoA hydratase family protein [Halieaceae bacterium]MDG1389946.1 crotonase/enoyl-CoA hydratase family protein [Halioglobus sp.]MBT5005099.1 crotonase/enoyl-CoA hydratase family protein [Halieaceae bacterium]MBT6124555.1 crotonase/enoyl-CoA hydratase family protein [Halieaceae bacterium]
MAELEISTKNCIVEQEGNVLIVTLNRPEAKNAFSPEMLLGMYKAWRLLDERDDLHCAILTANGDTFCAGMDLKAGADGEQGSTEEFMSLMAEVPNIHWQALLRENRPNKPLILAVEGYALAGGTEILQGTDIRVGADNAIFGVTEVARGLYPMSGSTIRLRRQIPYCLAAEMLLCGEHITAQQALDFGLINKMVPAGKTLEAAKEYAQKICSNGPLAVRAVVKSLREHQECLSEGDAMVASDELAGPVFASSDAKEGMRAFKEKRPAEFTGS